MTKIKTKTKQFVNNKNPIEQFLGIGGGAVQSGADLAERQEKQKKHQASGDLHEGEELNLEDLKKENKEKLHIEGGIDYAREIVHVGEKAVNRENRELENQLREIMAEIKKLADSSRELQTQFKEIAVEQHIAKPGKYHKSFFTWMLSMISAARQKVEDSGAWLTAMQSKKKSREYGAMAKKHGTTFSLSNERVVATQVG
ncbi:MAG: hypothetical protein HYW62_01280 [Candidatus Levybacteria bacterium]|nr:hypothetical protein [Candidatus Levybacteria bacterium]